MTKEQLFQNILRKKSFLCVGLDTDIKKIPEHLLKEEDLLAFPPEPILADEAKKVLIFRRKSCIFALNFNPSASFTDYEFKAPEGEWGLVFDSDDKDYDGFSRLGRGERHWSDGKMSLYLPSRCALVLKKIH